MKPPRPLPAWVIVLAGVPAIAMAASQQRWSVVGFLAVFGILALAFSVSRESAQSRAPAAATKEPPKPLSAPARLAGWIIVAASGIFFLQVLRTMLTAPDDADTTVLSGFIALALFGAIIAGIGNSLMRKPEPDKDPFNIRSKLGKSCRTRNSERNSSR